MRLKPLSLLGRVLGLLLLCVAVPGVLLLVKLTSR